MTDPSFNKFYAQFYLSCRGWAEKKLSRFSTVLIIVQLFNDQANVSQPQSSKNSTNTRVCMMIPAISIIFTALDTLVVKCNSDSYAF